MLRFYLTRGTMQTFNRHNRKRGQMTAQNEISIRLLSELDTDSVRRLAEVDSAPVPSGSLLGAIVDGRLVAAMDLESGESIADPFTSSEGARALLAERAQQLRGRGRGLRGLVRRRPAVQASWSSRVAA
jgi:hypothetical protein